jgi:ribosomal protein S18 acetylase RimI-like enzyme
MVISVRQAERNDALHVAALIDIAGHGIEAELWNDNVDADQSPIAAARRMIIEDVALPYHLSKAYLLEVDGEIAGGLIGGPVPEVKVALTGYPSYFEPLLELESRVPGYWAVIGVAVYQEFRGQGLARHLLDHAEFLARRQRSKGLSIVVEDTNTVAIMLYHRWGFQDYETRPWLSFNGRTGPKKWVLLTRSL